MGKYTDQEDRRQITSFIIRTVLGIAVTFGLLCWYSGGLPKGVEDFFTPDNLLKNIIPILILAAVIFVITRKYFSSVDMWKILLLNFCLGNGLPWLNILLYRLFIIRNVFLSLLYLDILITAAANLALCLKSKDNNERSIPASIGVYLLAIICFFAPLPFMGVFLG